MKETIWTPSMRKKLVEFVDRAVTERGITKSKAFEEFCQLHGEKYNVNTARVNYAKEKWKQRKQGTAEGAVDMGWTPYTDEEERILIIGSHFAPQLGLKKRDVYRLLADRFGRGVTALEQHAYALRKEGKIEIPEDCPPDILEFLMEAEERKLQRMRERRRQAQEARQDSEVSVVTSYTERAESETGVEVLSPAQTEDMDILEVLSIFAKSTQSIQGFDGEHFLKQLAVIASMASDRSEVGNLRNELFTLTRENNRLRNQCESMSKEVETLREQLREYDEYLEKIREQQEVVNFLVDEFTSIRTIEQVGALKEYTNQFRKEVDKMGNVISVVDVWKKKYAEQIRDIYAEAQTG